MTIEYKIGYMFDEPTEAIVNTVNCVGVMGKGVALEFKRRWPENFKEYKQACADKKLVPGQMLVFDNSQLFGAEKHRFLINFPTKRHWRSSSKIDDNESGLTDFVKQVHRLKIQSVTLPALGCGNGGLEWSEVKLLVEEAVSALPEVRFVVFCPAEQQTQSEQIDAPDELTIPRASLLVAFTELEKYFGGHLTRLTAQKIAYFLQVLGIDFGLEFSKEQYGPYSKSLHLAFKAMEKRRYIEGYMSDERKIIVSHGAYSASDEYLKSKNFDISNTMAKLSLLVEGYESPYGMELLSSVHFLAVTKRISTQSDMSAALKSWNEHKESSFPEQAVSAALERLKDDQLIYSN